jgi:hypothetical protein
MCPDCQWEQDCLKREQADWQLEARQKAERPQDSFSQPLVYPKIGIV